ncbi:MAG: hypothetical protein AAGB51_13270 [Planctomycetota bacterium]
MLAIDPQGVSFQGQLWEHVRFIVLDRTAQRVIDGYRDGGPNQVFCDVTKRRVVARVVIEATPDLAEPPALGTEGTLVFERAPNASGIGRSRVTVDAVVTAVLYSVSRSGKATQTVELRAVSSDPGEDPVMVSAV